jgi:hypothetical protein
MRSRGRAGDALVDGSAVGVGAAVLLPAVADGEALEGVSAALPDESPPQPARTDDDRRVRQSSAAAG